LPLAVVLTPDRYRIVIGALSRRYVRLLDCPFVGYRERKWDLMRTPPGGRWTPALSSGGAGTTP